MKHPPGHQFLVSKFPEYHFKVLDIRLHNTEFSIKALKDYPKYHLYMPTCTWSIFILISNHSVVDWSMLTIPSLVNLFKTPALFHSLKRCLTPVIPCLFKNTVSSPTEIPNTCSQLNTSLLYLFFNCAFHFFFLD